MKAFTAAVEKCLDTGLYAGIASPANQVRRRDFLIESGRAALGFSLLSLAGCSTVTQKSDGPRGIFLKSRIAEFMRVNILEPFGMTSSRFILDESYARGMATPHDKLGKQIESKPKTASEAAADLAVYGAAASLFTTPADYARFLLEILDPKPTDAFRLNENSRREYLRPQFKRDEITSSSLGWVVAQFNGLTSFTHTGSAAGWNCETFASTDRKSGIVILTNGDNFLPFRENLKLDLEFFTHLFAA